ncbi:MAG: NAD(P)-dependent oxidoreductase [Rhodobiaceae bacterium]|nr:NAD(P)-dependent oxidoreductase [Rhodobiaceae bacterium]MCC0047567.1 NAD(P)-dependent oxidoreductase [Rhodobiaceae bacterium]
MTKEPSGTAIAFIGLGMMGLPMAKRLVASGYDVTGFDLSENARSEFAAAGGKVAASVADACAGKDFAITMLPNERIVRDALMGDGGGAFSLPRGAVVIDMSSSAPSGTIELAKQLDAMGIALIDAPVSGGVKKAIDGSLAIMIGGEDATIDSIRPVLAPLAASLIVAGKVGAGHAIKSLNNFVSAAGLTAMSEALSIGQRFGIAPDTIIDVLNASSGRNNSTENKAKQFILSGTFQAGFTMALMAKDIGIAAKLAEELDIDAPALAATCEYWRSANEALGPGADHTEIYRYISKKS